MIQGEIFINLLSIRQYFSDDSSSSSNTTNNHISSRAPTYYDDEQSSIPSDIQCLNSELENEILLHRSVSQAAYERSANFHEPEEEMNFTVPEAFSRTLQFQSVQPVKIGNPKPLRRQESYMSEQPSMGKRQKLKQSK